MVIDWRVGTRCTKIRDFWPITRHLVGNDARASCHSYYRLTGNRTWSTRADNGSLTVTHVTHNFDVELYVGLWLWNWICSELAWYWIAYCTSTTNPIPVSYNRLYVTTNDTCADKFIYPMTELKELDLNYFSYFLVHNATLTVVRSICCVLSTCLY